MRLWAAPDHTRVVFDTSAPVTHNLFTLQNPDRLVVDVPAAQVAKNLQATGGLVKGIRAARNTPGNLRIVLDLAQAVKPRSFSLNPSGQYGHRLVIDLYGAAPGAPTAAAPAAKPAVKQAVASNAGGMRDLVIAIDAGHGGDDPGAIGRRKTREKDVVLAIARRLASLVEKEPGMRPVLIREGDYYVGLRQRIEKARKHKADLFISIHADGFTDHRAAGSSVYVLSRRGASSEMARVLAARENAADLVGGVSLDDKDDLLREVLLDLSQTATLEASFSVADNLLSELEHIGKTAQVECAAGRLRGIEVPGHPLDPGGDRIHFQSRGREEAARCCAPAAARECHDARHPGLFRQTSTARHASCTPVRGQARRHPERYRTAIQRPPDQPAWL